MSDRKALIRLASTLPKGSKERKAILAGLKARKAAIKDDMKVIVKSWDMEIVEDSYYEGEIGRGETLASGGGERFDRPVDLIKKFSSRYDIPKRAWYVLGHKDGRLGASWQTDENGLELTPKETEAWKKGEGKGYRTTLYIWVEFAKVYSPDPDEMSKMFRIGIG